MKYLCLVYLSKDHWNACPDRVCADYGQHLRDQGVLLAAEPLHPTETATTVRVRNGSVLLHDGPFAETKEQLGGYYVIEARDLNEAIRVASRIPGAWIGSVEVRPIADDEPTRRALGRA